MDILITEHGECLYGTWKEQRGGLARSHKKVSVSVDDKVFFDIRPSGFACLSMRPEKLMIDAFFGPTRDGNHLKICRRDHPGAVPTVAEWSPMNDKYQIIFAVSQAMVPHLFIEDKTSGDWLLPPLNNIYNDGVVCMPEGAQYQEDDGMDTLMRSWEIFAESPWNYDLAKDRPAIWDGDFNPIDIEKYLLKTTLQ